jgi:peptide deformylase
MKTMYNANMLVLAALTSGKSTRIFVIDTTPLADDEDLDSV